MKTFLKKNRELIVVIVIFLILWLFGAFDEKEVPVTDLAVTESVIDNLIDTRLTYFKLIQDNDDVTDASHLELKVDSKNRDTKLGTKDKQQDVEIEKAKKLPKPLYYGGDVKKLKAKDVSLDQSDEYLQKQIDNLGNRIQKSPKDLTNTGSNGEVDWASRWGTTNNKATTNNFTTSTYSNVNDDTQNLKWVDHIGGPQGVTVGGIGYIKKNLIDITHGSNPGYMCEYTSWTDGGAPMTLQGDYYIINLGQPLKPGEKSRPFVFCVSIGNDRYLPHELIKLGQLSSDDYQANGQGGYNFTTMPTGELITNDQ